jgi:hypothetical protein
VQRMYRRPVAGAGRGRLRKWSGWAGPSHPLKLWWSCSVLSGRKFQSHSGVPPGRLLEVTNIEDDKNQPY